MILKILGFILLAAGIAGAQTIRGRVTDRGTGEPLGGVVVSALTAAGKVTNRAVSDRASGYEITLPPATVKVQFRHIGFRPLVVRTADAVNGRIDAVMERIPTTLDPMLTTDAERCEPKPDRGQALALWDQVRSALLTSVVARETRSARVSVLLYQHDIDGGHVLPQKVERRVADSANRVFGTSASADSLAAGGYVEKTGDELLFHEPDELVLFDDSFVATHCFDMEKPRYGADTLIGLSFEPSRGRDRIPDVKGTVWMTTNPLDLSSVEYRYVGVDRDVSRNKAGGFLDFRRMPNGISMIYRWGIRAVAPPGGEPTLL
jgi:hypothetical protein